MMAELLSYTTVPVSMPSMPTASRCNSAQLIRLDNNMPGFSSSSLPYDCSVCGCRELCSHVWEDARGGQGRSLGVILKTWPPASWNLQVKASWLVSKAPGSSRLCHGYSYKLQHLTSFALLLRVSLKPSPLPGKHCTNLYMVPGPLWCFPNAAKLKDIGLRYIVC